MLPFVPRQVTKAANSQKNVTTKTIRVTSVEASSSLKEVGIPQGQQQSSNADRIQTEPNLNAGHSETQTRRKGKNKETVGEVDSLLDEDYVALLRLSFSEHALWSNPDLRRNLEHSDDGFLPLTYLLDTSPYRFTQYSESAVVKALRAHAEDSFDVRLLMSSPSRAEWYGKAVSSKQSVGAYELRFKTWKEALQRSRNSTRNDWEAHTVYVENIPAPFRSIAGVYHFISGLLPEDNSRLRVQSISLPKHHLDKPGDAPKCKGFALVTLLLAEDVNFLLQRWPWSRARTDDKQQLNPFVNEATKYGLRILSKSRWDALNSEYLQHRQRILDGIRQHEPSGVSTLDAAGSSAIFIEDKNHDAETVHEEVPPEPPALDLSAPYPLGCLIHIRHVHPETNKTTLRKLFSRAFTDGGDGIDYVDFNKGMDTCYLRLATPAYTTQLVSHFSDTAVVQATGLDDIGTSSVADRKAITLEVIGGKREELYWLKVPEKIRKQAVEKAVLGDRAPHVLLKKPHQEDSSKPEGQKSRRKRKR